MRDLAILLMLLGLAWVAWLRPWLGVLGLAVLSYMHPHGYATGFMRNVPVYMYMFAWVSLSMLYRTWRDKAWARLPWRRLLDWRLYGLLGLWIWFGVTSHYSVAPWEAWDKYRDVLKILPPFLLTLLLIDTRDKLYYLIVVMALSLLLVALKGGYWAVLSGFHDRVYGPPGSPYADNNEFAVAVAMAIPLMVLWLRETRDRGLRIFLLAGIALSYASVVSSWSRGGMLALGAMTLLLVWHSKRKLLAIPLLLVLVAVLFVQLPEQWFGRMESVTTYQADQSAQGRLDAWRVGLDFVAKHPVTGGGFNAWPALTLSSAGGRDWHSAYVEMLAEHGYGGLVLWAGLLTATLLSLTWDARRRPAWQTDYGAMLQASLMAYLVGSITLGIAYWELPYHLVVLAALLRGFLPSAWETKQQV
jgi:probable O-glycosylation ligase (exosortase A-associated)